HCERAGVDLREPSDADYAAIDPRLTGDVRAVLTVEGSIASRSGAGGTAAVAVAAQRAHLDERLAAL
ncbi:MAG: argininosuccinate lyase, partial [Actinomycetes bacterium]